MRFVLKAHTIGAILLAMISLPCTIRLYGYIYDAPYGLAISLCAIAAVWLVSLPFGLLYHKLVLRFAPARFTFLLHLALGLVAGAGFGYLNTIILHYPLASYLSPFYIALVCLHVQPVTGYFAMPYELMLLFTITILPFTMGHYLASKIK